MADGRRREAWQRTSSVLAMLVNVNRGKRSRAAKPSDFVPYGARRRAKAPVKKVGIGIFKALFIDKDMAKVAEMAGDD